jgi:hypothetical protein
MSKVTQKEIVQALREASYYAFYRDLTELADRIERYGISDDKVMAENELGS